MSESELDLLTNLKTFNSIQLQRHCDSWEEAILLCGRPLVEAGALKDSYLESVIGATREFGPYYIICEGVAMPHSADRASIVEDCFSLLTLSEPILFPGDEREVDTLLLLAVKNTDTHTGSALPQIIALFEDETTRRKIAKAATNEEVVKIISEVDYKRYLL